MDSGPCTNNQPLLIKGNKTGSVANPIRKSELIKEPTSLPKVINEHEDWLFENVQDEEIKLSYEDIQDQCFVAATRSRSKEASEKVPVFSLCKVNIENLNMYTGLEKTRL